ncbi:TPA: succinate dehydrogenase, hydrophobic membrane anchor protein [Legionella pneumophila subsp. pneumophila]|uniref:Succinate dehydrogenase hydrophobic membrane anchor subunit n=1 Tax=Legionella pneumophila (strain Lens) TaxID=297245 RepID=Q5WZ09_LEGPL|nr:succinate dehydrogenase, hydrophobic membrane anchor protein [Legionella pneumophila]AOW52768.1 succinate dehydrogenase, hydrophobic membrane anchor protein [Legionella pneumophila subsp. pneumophila]AOW56332.1 succinate dehydrogenase, hydrophobic membrane anchor protein [Legionella pneumophila subsp. pneumophila]AOW58078.1 succinate dehydrogenase, hydrophobic membrane anchor protein [Legionella pneumophila subsp. pneumophila]AOW61740.1 succinate dehydrogenase, hydrophobic membrane anchor pr
MVNNVTSLTGNGLKDWLIQRVTAVYFAAYLIFLFGFILANPDLNFSQWHLLFANKVFQIATTIGLIALTLHAWIGIWTVTTDYMKCTVIRLSVQLLVVLWLFGQFIWGLMIIWGQ